MRLAWPDAENAAAGQQHRGDAEQQDAVVDQVDEQRPQGDRDGLGAVDEHVGGRGDPALEAWWGEALAGGDVADQQPGHGQAHDHEPGQDNTEAGLGEGQAPAASNARASPTVRASPSRRRTRAAVRPPSTLPAPCTLLRTPKKDAGRCRPWSMTAKSVLSRNPRTLKATATTRAIRPSMGVSCRWWNPAVSSRRTGWRGPGSGGDSWTRMLARAATAAAKVAASSTASAPPPKAV